MDSCVLPLELINLIVDNLSNDISTLKSCSILCQALLSSCRKYIFSTLTLVFRTTHVAQLRALACLLQRSPETGTYVKQLSVIDNPGRGPGHYHDEVTLCQVLSYLSRVQELNVCLFARWSCMSARMRSGLSRIFQLPTLVDASISGIFDLPITIFSAFATNVKALQFCSRELDLASFNSIPFNPNFKRIELESLRISLDAFSVPLIINHPQSPFDFSHITTLDFTGDDSLTGLDQILKLCSSSLEYLTFSLWGEERLHFDFRHLHHLKRLKLSVFLSYSHRFTPHTVEALRFRRLIELLKSISTDSPLEETELIFGVHLLHHLENLDWGALDHALHPVAKQLHTLKIRAYMPNCRQYLMSDTFTIEKIIQQRMPMAFSSCVVEFGVFSKPSHDTETLYR